MGSYESCATGDVDARCLARGHRFERPVDEIAGKRFVVAFEKRALRYDIEATKIQNSYMRVSECITLAPNARVN